MKRQVSRRGIKPDSVTPVGIQLRDILLSEVQSGRYAPSTRIPSERELAETYGISRASVRDSITQLITQGVLVRRDRRGAYVAPDSQSRKEKTRTVAFLVSRHLLEFFQIRTSRILSGAQDFLHESDCRLIFHTIGDRPGEVRMQPLLRDGQHGISGCIIAGTVRRQTIDTIRAARIPMVFVDRDAASEEDIISVRADYPAGTRMAMRHLHELRHRTIGFIGFADSLKYRAYCDSLRDFRLAHNPDAVEFLEVFDLPPAILAGYQAVDRLMQRGNLPTSILVTNDLVAIGVMERLRIAGLNVPDDISIVGFDDLGQRTNPPLSRVRLDLTELGRVAAEGLTQRMDGISLAVQHMLVPVEFVVAASTARPR